jgi:hypothetical protein
VHSSAGSPHPEQTPSSIGCPHCSHVISSSSFAIVHLLSEDLHSIALIVAGAEDAPTQEIPESFWGGGTSQP